MCDDAAQKPQQDMRNLGKVCAESKKKGHTLLAEEAEEGAQKSYTESC